MPNARRSWPYNGMAESPPALTQTPDGLLRSDRSLVGPLRRGTARGVGPGAGGGFPVDARAASDFGVDSITPRHFDPMGTSDMRAPPFPGSRRVRR